MNADRILVISPRRHGVRSKRVLNSDPPISASIRVSDFLKSHWLRVRGVRMIVKTLARFLSEPACQNEALQKRWGGEATLLELVEHHMGDVVRGVEADEVEQGERPHGVSAAELHRVVDVGDRAHTFLVSANGIEQIGNEQTVDDEA